MIAFEDRGLSEILIEVCAAHFCTTSEVLDGSRLQHVSAARRALSVRLHALGMSFSAIGRLLGMHHTSVLEHVNRRRWAKPRHGRVAAK